MNAKRIRALCLLSLALGSAAHARPEQAWRAGSDAEAAAANAAAGAGQSQPQPRQQPSQPQPRQESPQPQPQPRAPQPSVPQQPTPRSGTPPQLGVPSSGASAPSDPGRGHWSTGGRSPGEGARQDSRRDDRRFDSSRDGDRRWTGGRGAPSAHQSYQWRDYDRYRTQHFRSDGGRYFGRSRYRLGAFYWPRGYASNVWLIGGWLPSVFFLDTRYQLLEYWRFGLYDPPLGTHWLRVGTDALLVDDFNGEVLDAIYDLFW